MDVSQLRKQAKALVKFYPDLINEHPQKLPLNAAQRTIAKLQGYPSWEALVGAAATSPKCQKHSQNGAQLHKDQACIIRVELLDTEPLVWRQIEVPCDYSFWDLHVAIQDVMGWNDTHLHEFSLPDGVLIGIPEEGDTEAPAVWEHYIADYFTVGMKVGYLYDFGDNWRHRLLVVEQKPRERGKYPRCTAGANLAPPDDSGGVWGWEEIKELMTAPDDTEEYQERRDWLRGWGRRYIPFDPLKFDAKKVKFDHPGDRFREAFDGRF